MTLYKDQARRREIIMKRYLRPLHKIKVDHKKYESVKIFSTSCIDKIELFYKFENNKLIFAKWIGEGCAIFIASSDIFVDQVIGKNIEQIKEIVKAYTKMTNGQVGNYDFLNDLQIFANIKKHLNRLECGNLIRLAFEKII